jgi:predicted small metal-binding protein
MNRLECPVEGCSGVIEAETEDEVMSQAEAHAAEKHPDMELDESTVADIKSKIVQI